ncbi:MAG: RidA family protein [Chloroflexi bacterium]|jgi:enamine deaminase RidA (YjgF/YER057c/UK114 family)|nr:RidA family protein [Chloroflexota bacterium]
MTPEAKLAELGLELPPAPAPQGAYRPVVQAGRLLFLSGHLPLRDGQPAFVGRVGADLSLEDGQAAARQTALNMLATLKAHLGELSRVRRVVKLLGMVNCTEEFTQTPRVLNGASEVFIALWGEQGKHARSAVGFQAIPGGMAVEIDAIFEVAE